MRWAPNSALVTLISSVLAVNLFVVGLFAYGLVTAREQREREIRSTIDNVARLVDQSIGQAVSKVDLSLRDIVATLEFELQDKGGLGRRDINALLAERQKWLLDLAEFRVLDSDGVFLYGPDVRQEARVSIADHDYFIAHSRRDDLGLLVSNPIVGRVAKGWIIAFTRRYNNADGSFAGIVSAAVHVDYFADLLSGIDLGAHGVVLLRAAETALIARFPKLADPAQQIGTTRFSKELAGIIASGAAAATYHTNRTGDNEERTNTYRRLSSAPFHLVAGMSPRDYLVQWRTDIRKVVAVALLFIAATSTGAWLLWRSLAAVRQANEDLQIAAVAFESRDAVVVTDPSDIVVRVNRAFTELTGYAPEDVLGKTPQMLVSDGHADEDYAAMWQTIRSEGGWAGELWHRRRDGGSFPARLTITAVRDGKGRLTHHVGIFSDITQRVESEAKIRDLAFYDPLTRLPNRRLLMDRLQASLAASKRDSRYRALLFVDLDNFKTLNDTLGHQKGDLFLQEVARRLGACVRESDTVARLGGDEFVIVLEGLSGQSQRAAAQAEAVGDKILAMVDQPFGIADRECRSTASIGITLFKGTRGTLDDLLRQADIAMYEAKAAGRNTTRFFAQSLQAALEARTSLEVDLRRGIESGQLVLWYQPQMARGRLSGAEALVRWNHPARGQVLPGEFIPLAEETGLILPLGALILDVACRQIAAWSRREALARVTLSVNVSGRQFRQPDFAEVVLAAVERHGAAAGRLKLELTESMLIDDVEESIRKMALLKARGIRFSIDDFGTGYSSLAYLKRLPLDELKIDRSFVRDLLTGRQDGAIAQTIIALGRALGLSVIAEGVESQEEVEALARLGCHAYQGYLFGRPLPLEDFEGLARHLSARHPASSADADGARPDGSPAEAQG